jgi:hypothetical protein
MNVPLKILGIYREEKFSNRAVDADRSIMDAVLKSLEKVNGNVREITAIVPEVNAHIIKNNNWDLIFSMAQDERILDNLDKLESKGTVVVNTSKSIRNCYRNKLSELLCDDSFSYPGFLHLDVNSKIHQTDFDELNSSCGYWVKRGDFHALVDEDVVHIETLADLPLVLDQFKKRGVDKVILQENRPGELFKFYGVQDSYFSLRHMGKSTNNRYITETGNSQLNFDSNHLEKLVHKAARKLELDYFGGDCIISDTGKIHFIDFNDWPSFRTCRDEVAPYMASYALKKLHNGGLNVNSFTQ